MEDEITTVICYCSNDRRFLDRAIEESKHFSKQIVVPVCDHFFDGSEEDREILEETYHAHPDITFVQFSYDGNKPYSPYLLYRPNDKEWSSIWHATARYVGYIHASTTPYYLFLDCDEIPEGERFAHWLKKGEYKKYVALRFLCYRYFYKPSLRSTTFHHNALLIQGDTLCMNNMIQPYERYGTFFKCEGNKKERIAENDHPFFHHFNWVKTKEEMIKKAQCWGHRWEKNWIEEIETLFEKEEEKDFAFGEKLEKVRPFFDPLQEPLRRKSRRSDLSHVIYTDRFSVFQKMVDRESISSI